MKELTTEEKIKTYNEKIRKAIIDFFNEPGRKEYILNGFTVDDIIDWLERSDEQKEIDYNEELKKCKDNLLYFFDKYVKVKFKKQIHVWSEEDEKIRKTLIHIIKGACGKYGIKYQGKEINEEKLLDWIEKLGKYKI